MKGLALVFSLSLSLCKALPQVRNVSSFAKPGDGPSARDDLFATMLTGDISCGGPFDSKSGQINAGWRDAWPVQNAMLEAAD